MPKLNPQQIDAAKNQGYEAKTEDLQALPCANGEAYVYKLLSCTAGPSKSSGRPQWEWVLTLDARYHPNFVGNGYLEKLWHYTGLDGGKEWAVAKMLHAFGYDPETDTDELINDEATVLAYVNVTTNGTTNGTPGKPQMKARRFAQHYEDEVPKAKSPMQIEAEERAEEAAAFQAAAAGQAPVQDAASAAPTDDPWATTSATVAASPAAAPVAEPADDAF
jgi:hypothetical protein